MTDKISIAAYYIYLPSRKIDVSHLSRTLNSQTRDFRVMSSFSTSLECFQCLSFLVEKNYLRKITTVDDQRPSGTVEKPRDSAHSLSYLAFKISGRGEGKGSKHVAVHHDFEF